MPAAMTKVLNPTASLEETKEKAAAATKAEVAEEAAAAAEEAAAQAEAAAEDTSISLEDIAGKWGGGDLSATVLRTLHAASLKC